jgi:hypothetical protein
MAERDTRRVAHALLGEPHIAGRRVSVRQVHALVERAGAETEGIADRFDLDVADGRIERPAGVDPDEQRDVRRVALPPRRERRPEGRELPLEGGNPRRTRP